MAHGQNKTIASMSAAGHSTRDIEKATGVSRSAIAVRLKTPQIRALLAEANANMAKEVVKVTNVLIAICYDYKHKDQMAAIKTYCQIMGLSPSHATSQFITNIYNDNRVQTVNPGVLQALGGNLSMLTGQDEGVQDGEYEETEGD